MNLLEDKWIQVRREDGTFDTVAPWQITEENPPIEFDGGFFGINGGYVLFLIGVFQTCLRPKNELAWDEWWENPPSPQKLREMLSEHKEAFEMTGDGYRYFQAPPSLRNKIYKWGKKKESANSLPKLLNGQYSANKLDQNVFGIKNLDPEPIPMGDVAAFLTWAQMSGVSKQLGNMRATLRQNAAVNCIVRGDTIWETVWHNVLSSDRDQLGDGIGFYELVDIKPDESPKFEFPWMQDNYDPTKTAYGSCHPNHLYWHMPTHVVLEEDKDGKFVSNFFAKPTKKIGIKDGWKHPLSGVDPSRSKENPIRLSGPLRGDEWVKLRFPKEGSKAPVFTMAAERGKVKNLQAWFLCSVNKGIAKNIHNVDKVTPLILCNSDVEEILAEHARWLRSYLKEASDKFFWRYQRASMSIGDANGIKGKFDFWSDLEPIFFGIVSELRDLFEKGKTKREFYIEIRLRWIEEVNQQLLKTFDKEVGFKNGLKGYLVRGKTFKKKPKAKKVEVTSPVLERSYLRGSLIYLKNRG